MVTNKLAKQQSAQTAIVKSSPKASVAVTVVQMLDLAATVTGYKDLTQQESDLWLELLEPYPAKTIEFAFKKYLTVSTFFPKPADILPIVIARIEDERGDAEELRTAQMLEENRLIREKLKTAGEPYGAEQYAQLVKELKAIVNKMPEPEANRRNELLKRVNEARQKKAPESAA